VAEDLSPAKINGPQGDVALAALIRKYQKHRDRNWLTILTAIYRPLLQILYNVRIKAVSAEQIISLWSDINWLFIKTLNKLDLGRRQVRLSAMIYNQVLHDLKCITKTNREESNRLCGLEDKEALCDFHATSKEDWNIQRIDIIRSWQKLKDLGRLDELDFHLLKATVLYNESLIEYAGRLGLEYEFVKKRRQRALEKIKKYSSRLSPNRQQHPL